MPQSGRTSRVEFTGAHDNYLVKYLARHCPAKEGRSGRRVYEELMDNQNEWPWAKHHTSQSWRERYVKNQGYFDARIRQYQRKHNIEPVEKRKRPAEPVPAEMSRPGVKRVRVNKDGEEEERPLRSEMRVAKSMSKSLPERLQEVQSQPPDSNPPRKPESANARSTTPVGSPSRPSASASATKQHAVDLTPPQTRHETLEITSSSPDRQVLPQPCDSTRHVKHTKVRLRTPSDMFASEPSSPKMDTAISVDAPSSRVQPALSVNTTGIDFAPVTTSTYPRAPPRVVDSLHGQVLVDREGCVPPVLPHGESDGAQEEEGGVRNQGQWPPVRRNTTGQRSEPNDGAHHAFSQSQPQPQPEVVQEHTSPEQLGRREDVVPNGATPVKRIVTTAPLDPFSEQIPKPPPHVFRFPLPRASTMSPFRPESPSKETRRPPSPTKAARHPALNRIRRQTIGHGQDNNRDGKSKGRENKRDVPSIDLVALSHSSTSARSHSRSSTDASVPERASRLSLPALPYTTPWVFGEPERQTATSFMYDDSLGHGHGGMSTPRFMLTPSPARPITGGTTSVSHANGVSASSSVLLTPHPTDLPLTASHGLASILAHMSANHGLALSVVEAVYKRVGSLREADEVLNGMREAAEGFGEREIKRRKKERRGREGGRGKQVRGNRHGKALLRYVLASEDGEGSENPLAETSRAAMQQPREARCEEERNEDEMDAEEGRAVEEELRERDEDVDDHGVPHDFSRQVALAETEEVPGQDKQEERPREDLQEEQGIIETLLGDTRAAQELERKLGKGRYRRDIVKLFV